jgi:hypothetical protein
MRFSPRSLLAWIAVAIAGSDPLGGARSTRLPAAQQGWTTADAGPDAYGAPRG